MKKLGFLLVLSLLMPSLALAATTSAERKISAKKNMFNVAIDDAKKKKEAELAKKDAERAAQKASKSLLALAKAYPEYATKIEYIERLHNCLVNFGKTSLEDEESNWNKSKKGEVYSNILQQMASLKDNVVDLPETVQEQVRKIIDHKYWVEANQEAASLARMFYMTSNYLNIWTLDDVEEFYQGLRGN